MKLQRKYFFDHVRSSLFSGSMTQEQVDGCNFLLSFAEKIGIDDRHLAYCLATVFHETARTMAPIAEYGKGQGKEYGKPDPQTGQTYYGRGYVQLTWKDNYQKQDNKLHLRGELVANADLAMEPAIAAQVLFGGMMAGDFTGKSMYSYITCDDPADDTTDFYNCRKVVNGLDCADQIENYATKFAAAIMHAESGPAKAA